VEEGVLEKNKKDARYSIFHTRPFESEGAGEAAAKTKPTGTGK
jgi:hypothetical protein